MYKRLLRRRLPHLSTEHWVSIKDRVFPVKVKTVILAAEIIEAVSFTTGVETVERFRFSQVTDIHHGEEAKIFDKIIANSRLDPGETRS